MAARSDGLGLLTHAAIAEARGAWPTVHVPDEVFAACAVARAGGGPVGDLHLGDLYLACACARGDAEAIAVLERAFFATLAGVVARSGAPSHVGEDVTQILRERLLVSDGQRAPRIAEYSGRGTLAGWLRVAAVREASKVIRHERGHANRHPDEAPPPATPEEASIRARYGDAFQGAFRDAFRTLPPEERLILRLHFAEGLSLDGLALALGFSRATAGRRVLSARTRLRDETLRLLEDQLNASREEVESVLAALRSRLEVSMSALITAA